VVVHRPVQNLQNFQNLHQRVVWEPGAVAEAEGLRAVFGPLLSCWIDLIFPFRPHHVDRHVHQLADHRLDIAADVPDFR